MLRYTFKRLISLLISLAVASVVIFAVIEVAPGDPASFMLGVNAQEDTLAALRTELGLDGSKVQRYLNWVGGMLVGDFGTSYTYRTPVSQMIADRLWVSLPLALYALTLSTLIAFPAGIYAAARRGKPGDLAVMGATQLGIAVPNFWFAMMLGGDLRHQPALVRRRRVCRLGATAVWTGLHSLTLPAIALGPAAGGNPGAGDAVALLDISGRGFHAHRPRQGADKPPAGSMAARGAQRDDPGADHHRAAVFLSAGRRRSSSNRCSILPGTGPTGVSGDFLARSDRGGKRW